jgi:DNA-binding LacI/PurR family transcriptional regulator
MKSTTISDIARIAGVSKSTVSRVLTGNSFVDDSKKEKILKAIEDTSYVPKLAARSLRGRSTGSIGVILNLDPDYHFSDYVSMETLRGISSSAQKLGFRVSVIIEPCTRAIPTIMRDQSVDGLIVMGLKEKEEVLISLAKSGEPKIPIVLLNYSEEYKTFPTVSFRNEENAYDFAMYVISMGHKKIGVLDSSKDVLAVTNRKHGILRALKDSGIDFRPEWYFEYSDIDQMEAGKKVARRITALDEKPSVLIASADDLALSFIAGITSLGLRVPDDISVVGVDDIPMSRYANPPLTTEKVEGYRRGLMAFKSLKTLLDGKELEKKHIKIRSVIVERDSLKKIK